MRKPVGEYVDKAVGSLWAMCALLRQTVSTVQKVTFCTQSTRSFSLFQYTAIFPIFNLLVQGFSTVSTSPTIKTFLNKKLFIIAYKMEAV